MGRSNDAELIEVERSNVLKHTKVDLSEDMQQTINSREEVAIIAYWKKDKEGKEGTFECYHYFYVPKPCKRYMRHSLRTMMNG